MRLLRKLCAIVTLLLLFSGVATADTTTFECNYLTYSDRDGLHKVNGPFKLTFLIDIKTKKGYMIGNNGSSEVVLILNDDEGLTLVETTGTGNVMVTAIAAKGESVHSRSPIMGGSIVPSQYYGRCGAK